MFFQNLSMVSLSYSMLVSSLSMLFHVFSMVVLFQCFSTGFKTLLFFAVQCFRMCVCFYVYWIVDHGFSKYLRLVDACYDFQVFCNIYLVVQMLNRNVDTIMKTKHCCRGLPGRVVRSDPHLHPNIIWKSTNSPKSLSFVGGIPKLSKHQLWRWPGGWVPKFHQ